MINISFSPFPREIRDVSELNTSDLAVLRDVSEGCYVEYKSNLVSPANIAKSLAAFANHYGGWIFYGVSGVDSGNDISVSFPGLIEQEVTTLIERIRNASKDSVNPPPY